MNQAVATSRGRKLGGRYTLVAKLGAGGQAEVWRAHDEVRGVDIALKILRPQAMSEELAWRTLEHEHSIASRLDHPSILKVFPPERLGELQVLPMELASGGDLRRLRGTGFLEIIPVLLEIGQALEHAHERGVVHRDLKPGNVLFDIRGRARLADFGVAETAGGAESHTVPLPNAAAPSDAARHGFSPFTASPGQLKGESPTPADDVYGLGALAYELLSGYPPYYPQFNLQRAIEEPVPQLVPTRQIPPKLGALVMRMLSKDPVRRPESMREVIDELDAALNDTLTFDFEALLASRQNESGDARPGGGDWPAALFSRDEPAANMTEGPPADPAWSADSGIDRRAVPDRRRIRRRELGVSPTVPVPAAFRDAVIPPTPLPGTGRLSVDPDSGLALGLRPESPAPAQNAPPASVTERQPAPMPEIGDTTRVRRYLAGAGSALPRTRFAALEAAVPASRSSSGVDGTAQTAVLPTLSESDVPRESGSEQGNPLEAVPAGTVVDAQSAALPPSALAAHSPHAELAAMEEQAASASAGVAPVSPETPHDLSTASDLSAPPWKEIPLEGLRKVSRLEPIPSRRWPWVLLGLLGGAAAAVYFWLPRLDPSLLPAELAEWVTTVRPASTTTGAQEAVPGQAGSGSAVPTEDSASASGGEQSGGAQPPLAAASEGQSPPDSSVGAGTTVAAASAAGAPAPSTPSKAAAVAATQAAALAAERPAAPSRDPKLDERLKTVRHAFDARLVMLEARGAGAWGGRDFARAKARAAESAAARDAGDSQTALARLTSASRLLDGVEARAPQALADQVSAGEQALGTGQQEVAGQAFDLAHRIDPRDRRAVAGQRRAQSLNGVLPLLADAQNAENAREFARAAQDYSQALSLDPGNAAAKAGQARANAAFGDDNYAKAVGAGFAALGAGRLDQAHEEFVKARALKPRGPEAAEGLRRVGAALIARGFASIRQRAAGLEAQERWPEALQAYQDVLSADPSLAFAQEGRARAASRAELNGRLQAFIDHPDRLASPPVRQQARTLLETARAQSPAGPVLRAQIAHLAALLPGFDRPVRLSLLSDNSTQVVIASVGSFGSFARRDIQLRPGRYTVVGKRDGFRDVRREITVTPGQDTQIIRVTCSEPI